MTPKNCIFAFICVNKKTKGKCCSTFNAEEIFEYFKKELARKHHLLNIKNKVRIKAVQTSCLGQCAYGPNIFIVPDNVWYTFSCKSDIDELINTHFMRGEIVTRLINKGIHHEYACEPA